MNWSAMWIATKGVISYFQHYFCAPKERVLERSILRDDEAGNTIVWEDEGRAYIPILLLTFMADAQEEKRDFLNCDEDLRELSEEDI